MNTLIRPSKVTGIPRITYEQFLEWSAGNAPHAEWVNGEVYLRPAVSDEHNWITGYLIRLLSEYAERCDLGVVHHDPFQMKLEHGLPGRQPDVFFVKKQNASRIR